MASPMRMTVGQRVRMAAKALSGDPFDVASILAGILPGGRGDPPKRGTKEYLEAYSQMPWLRAVSERVADQVARTGWHVLAKKGGNGRAVRDFHWQHAARRERVKIAKALRKAGTLIEVEASPLLEALQGGNAIHPGSQVAKLGQLDRDLVGDSFELKERNAFGAPVALWNVPPSWCSATPTPAAPFFEFSYRGWHETFPASEVLWQMNPDPANPYGRGSGIARSLSDELETDDYAAKFMRNRFYNQARPDLIVYGEGLTPDQTRTLEDRWTGKLRSFAGVAKPFFMNQKITVQEVGQTFADLQLVELRKYERDMIVHVFGLPPEIFGILESSNRSTIDAAAYIVGKFATLPRLEERQEFLQARLVPDYDDRLVLEYDSPVDEDWEFKLKVMQAFPWAFDVDAQRDLADAEPLEANKGKVFMVPFQYVPVKSPGEAGTPGEAWAQPGGDAAPPPPEG